MHDFKVRQHQSFGLIISLLFLSLLLSACASLDKLNKKETGEDIDYALNDFRKSIRWGYYDSALKYIQVKEYKGKIRDTAYLKDVRITSYEYGSKKLSEDGNTATVTAAISYYNVNRGTVHDIHEQQTWRYNAEAKLWLLDGDLPDLTPQ